jgi:hypothetical protein
MGNDLVPSHHHHYYHTDNSAVERIEKLRREDEAKFQMQIAKLEQEKKELKNYMYDSINKILQETKNQNQLLKREYEQQKIDDEIKWNEHIKIIQDNYAKQREDDKKNRIKENELRKLEIEMLKEQIYKMKKI